MGAFRIDIRENLDAVKAELSRLQADIRDKAIARALNRTMEQAKTQMTRGISAEFAIKSAEVRTALKISPAKGGYGGGLLTADLYAHQPKFSRGRNLIRFGARQVVGAEKKLVRFLGPRGWAQRVVPVGGGVTVKIKRGGRRTLIRHAFIANQGRTVFIREGSARKPIKALTTIGVGQMFNTRRINAVVVRVIKAKFPEILAREVRFYVERFGK